MGSAFHQLCPRYSGTLTPTAPTAIRLWDTFTFIHRRRKVLNIVGGQGSEYWGARGGANFLLAVI